MSSKADVQYIIVWINMLEGDTEKAANNAARMFNQNQEVAQFYDPERSAGQAIASSLGASSKIAWDMYLLYDVDTKWDDNSPVPMDWVHQLGNGEWAGADRFRWGESLKTSLLEMIHRLGRGDRFT